MKIRSALMIAGGMAAGTLLIAVSTNTPASFRTSAVTPVVYAQPRTELLPPEAALYDPPTTTTTTTTAPPAPVQPSWDTVTPYERVEWSRVNVCENGGDWLPRGSAYPDGLGISSVNWYSNGGGSDLSEDAQIMVAEKIQFDPPDQDGVCAAW